jgi:antitoxin CcdA
MTTSAASKKKAINVSIDPKIAADAKAAGLNISGVLEGALRAELKSYAESKWKAENRETIEHNNRYFEERGLPLDKYRVW